MNRGFYSYSLLCLIAMILLSVTAIVAHSIYSTRTTAITAASVKLTSAHESTRTLISARDDLLRETALGLSIDPRVNSAVMSLRADKISAALAARSASDRDNLILVVTKDGRVRAHTGPQGRVDAINPDLLFAGDPTAVVMLNDAAHQVAFAPLQAGREMWVGVATPIDRQLLDLVQNLTGVDVTVSSGANSIVSTRVGQPAESDLLLEAPLDARGANVTFAYSMPQNLALQNFGEFAAKSAAAGLVVSALAIVLGVLTLGLITSRKLNRPLRQLTAAVERVQKGVYNEVISVAGDDRIARLARALNTMQTEIGERESRIVHHAEYDSLTGLTNRSVVADRLKAVLARTTRKGSSAAAMIVDIERFGDINGAMGNEIGDAVLQEVARRLASNTRATDLLARVGGDEFLIVVEDMEDKLATHMSEFLADTLEKPIEVRGRSVSLRVHVGAAMYPNHSESPEGLRRLANVALITAKENALRVVMYEPGQDERQLRELAVLNDLDDAVKNDHLFLRFQPKIDMKTRSVDSLEALVRWQHPQLGMIPPDEFIGLLEHHNKIHKLTDWVLKKAVEQLRDWTSKGFDLSVAVNISANDLLDMDLSVRIGNLLHHYLVDPKRLSIEVTESAVMRDPDQASLVLQTLRELGIRISIDDFGTGQTSLSLLKKLPLNELKIDQSFVRNLRADSGDGIIIKSMVDLGHNMGLLVVAEGVENTYSWNLLKSYGCDTVQGYLVAKPLGSTELEHWYLKHQAKQANRLDLAFMDKEDQAEQANEAAGEGESEPDSLSKPNKDLLSEILGS